MGKRAVFLDRDDTVIRNIPYLGDPALVELMPHVRDALAHLRRAGFLLIIASNQSGVGRGLITVAQVDAVNARMDAMLGGGVFAGYYACHDDPRTPGGHCRKPSPTMLLQAARDLGLDLTASYMVGDRLHDVQAGLNAGCRAVHYRAGNHPEDDAEAEAQAHFASADWPAVAAWILADAAARGPAQDSASN